MPKFSRKNSIKVEISNRVKKGKIGTATVSKDRAGEYYVSFIVHTKDDPKPLVSTSSISKSNALGIDFGL